MNRPISSCQSLEVFPMWLQTTFSSTLLLLSFYIFHTHTHPPSYPCLDNLLTLQYIPLTLWVSTPHYVFSNATFSKEPLTKLSALLWIYIDSYLYYSSDISLCKHSLSHSTNVYWAHFCVWYYLSGSGIKTTLKKLMASTSYFGYMYIGVISSSSLKSTWRQGCLSYLCNLHNS